MTAKFVEHTACPKCGSADNVAKYDDGFEICYSPGCDYVKRSNNPNGHSSGDGNEPVSYYPLLDGDIPTILTEYRGLTREALIDYGIKKIKVDGAQSIQFPYYLNGVSVAAKYRGCTDFGGNNIWKHKHFWSKGTISKCRLFGMQACSFKKKSIIITEGELDALAAYSMYGLAHNVVSIANGAKSAAQAIKQHMDWLIQFETIYINFDMDEPGQEAANECMSLFPPGKARNVILPEGYKDACDMSRQKQGELYRKVVRNAQAITPQGVLDREDVIASTLDYILDIDQRKGVSTGYKQLDNVMGGFRPGELITLVAGTGVGKTTMTLNLTYNAAMKSDLSTLFIPLEMSYKQVLVRLMEIHLKQPIMTTTDQPSEAVMNEELLKRTLGEVTNNVSIYNHIGALNLQKLIGVIEYYAISQKTKLVVLDHKDAAVNSLTDEGGGVKLIDNLMAELKRVAIQYNLTVLVVSHQSRSKEDKEDNKASLGRVRGSAGVAQNSDLVLGIERERHSNEIEIVTLKAHRIFGIYDRFKLVYDPSKLRIVELLLPDINAIGASNNNGSQEETEKRVREGHSKEPPRPVIRTKEVSVHEELHPRLPASDSDGEGDIHRSEGTLPPSRQDKDVGSSKRKSKLGLKDIIHERQQPSKSKVQTFFHLRRLGNKKQL